MKRIFLLSLIILLTLSSISFANSNLKTYENTEFNFEISYPQEWTVDITDIPAAEKFFQRKIGSLMVTMSPLKGWNYIGVIVIKSDKPILGDPYTDEYLNPLIARVTEPLLGAKPDLISKSMVTVNGMKAMKTTVYLKKGALLGESSELQDETYFIFHNNFWYEISLGGNPAYLKDNRKQYDESLNSFKFLSE